MDGDRITASEIGEFIYCRRLWWKNRNQKTRTTLPSLPKALGTAGHNSLNQNLNTYTEIRRNSQIILIIGFCLVFMLFVAIFL